MGDFVTIEIPNYYYWEGDSPPLPKDDTQQSYKLIGPDSTTITMSSGFSVEATKKGYKFVAKRGSCKVNFLFSSPSVVIKNGITIITTANLTQYTFKGLSAGINKYEVKRGNITIKENVEQQALNATKDGIEMINDAKDTYVKNTIAQSEFLKTDAIYNSSSTMDKITKLFFLFFNDFFTIVIIAFFVIGILLITKANKDYIYPTNQDQFPYISKEDRQKVFDLKGTTAFCSTQIEEKDILPHKIEKNDDNQYAIDQAVVKIFNDIMNGDKVYDYSSTLQEKCKNTNNTSGAVSVLVYWILYLRLASFYYMQSYLNKMHGLMARVNKVPVVLPFTILLVLFYLLVQNINKGVLQPYFHYNEEKGNDFDVGSGVDVNAKRGVINIIVMNLINIVALFLVVAVPLFIVLSIACFIGNSVSLINIMTSSSSVECIFLSFFAIICSVNFILKLLPEDLNITKIKIEGNTSGLTIQVIDFILNMFRLIRLPDLNINNLFIIIVNIFTFLGSIFGVFLPFFMALVNSIWITYKITYSACILPFRIPYDIFSKTLMPAIRVVVLILLFLLLVHIHDLLDMYLFILTFFIILIIGYTMSKN
jgi:hypothetical protein